MSYVNKQVASNPNPLVIRVVFNITDLSGPIYSVGFDLNIKSPLYEYETLSYLESSFMFLLGYRPKIKILYIYYSNSKSKKL